MEFDAFVDEVNVQVGNRLSSVIEEVQFSRSDDSASWSRGPCAATVTAPGPEVVRLALMAHGVLKHGSPDNPESVAMPGASSAFDFGAAIAELLENDFG
jgi:hypothetical protein